MLNEKKLIQGLESGPPYDYINTRIDQTERLRFPSFVKCFNELVGKGIIPTFDMFCCQYMAENFDELSKLIQPEWIEGMIGRLSRTYPSLLREFQVYLLLRKHPALMKIKAKVSRGHKMDMQGIDVMIERGGKRVGLRIFQDSRRSRQFKKAKDKRAKFDSNIQTLDVPFKEAEANRVNNYWLFKHETVDKVAKEIVKLVRA